MDGVARQLVRGACLMLLLFTACTTRGEQSEPPTLRPLDTATTAMTPTPSPTATPTATPTPTPMPTPEASPTVTVAPGFAALESELAAVVAGYTVPGQYAFALTDLQTGETIGVNADEWRLGACTLNFFVLLTVVHDVDTGTYPMTEHIDGLIAQTIYSSNATTARELWSIVGDGDVRAGVAKTATYISEELGLDGVILDHPPLYPEESLCTDPDNWITARAANEVLGRLYRGELLSPEWTGYLLEQMTHVKDGLNYLTACCNGGITSHKNGFFPYAGGYVDNDIGIVRFWRGDTGYAYAVSFFSMEVKVKYDDIPLAQDLMWRSWAWFDAAYP